LTSIKKRTAIQTQIKNDINQVHNIHDEYIAAVFLEMEVIDDNDWREASGVLLRGERVVPPDATKRIWGNQGFRLFLSHKSDVKSKTARLREELRLFGISGFVAHEDIHPTKKWQDEIENALASMDGFVALLTDDFHESDWTDQEVGYALARGVPIIAVCLGKIVPYGFIGKSQGLPSTWIRAAGDIVEILIKNDRMVSAYVDAVRQCPNFNGGNALAQLLPSIERLDSRQIDQLVTAYNESMQLQGSYGFNGAKPQFYGPGLVSYVNRLGTQKFRFTKSRLIEAIS
jgi:hypothetical protein